MEAGANLGARARTAFSSTVEDCALIHMDQGLHMEPVHVATFIRYCAYINCGRPHNGKQFLQSVHTINDPHGLGVVVVSFGD